MFQLTQDSAALSVLLLQIKDIQKAFGIDWPSVKWTDLTKPLYSALGARLYIQYSSRNEKNGIPRAVNDQATFWKKYYGKNEDTSFFVKQSNHLEQGTTLNNLYNGVSLAFGERDTNLGVVSLKCDWSQVGKSSQINYRVKFVFRHYRVENEIWWKIWVKGSEYKIICQLRRGCATHIYKGNIIYKPIW